MTKSQLFNERITLIQGDIFSCLKTLPNFEAIKYVKDPNTDREYVRITDYIGGKVYLEITGKSDADVFIDIARMVLCAVADDVAPPETIITDNDEKSRVSHFFRPKA